MSFRHSDTIVCHVNVSYGFSQTWQDCYWKSYNHLAPGTQEVVMIWRMFSGFSQAASFYSLTKTCINCFFFLSLGGAQQAVNTYLPGMANVSAYSCFFDEFLIRWTRCTFYLSWCIFNFVQLHPLRQCDSFKSDLSDHFWPRKIATVT